MVATPNFSAFPWDRVPRLTRGQAAIESCVAAWIGARGRGDGAAGAIAHRIGRLAGGDVHARVATPSDSFDPHAARCVVRRDGVSIEVLGASMGVRAIAQRMLGGPAELQAPRPLGVVEHSLWSLVVAAALEDLAIAGQVWPQLDGSADDGDLRAAQVAVALDVALGDIPISVELRGPGDLALRGAPSRPAPAWAELATLDAPIVVGRCALPRDAIAGLAPRSLVTLEAPATRAERTWGRVDPAIELEVLGGSMGLRAAPGAVVAAVTTGYVPRDMSLPDDAHVELTVALGTTRLSLRQVFDLAIGQVVPLGRPLAGPFELRASGRVIGHGELVDVDGELAVRIVSLGE